MKTTDNATDVPDILFSITFETWRFLNIPIRNRVLYNIYLRIFLDISQFVALALSDS